MSLIGLFDVLDKFSKRYQGEYQDPLQQVYSYDINLTGVIWNAEPAIMVVINDISWNMRYIQSQQISNYKDELLAMVSHDLKTPLNGIISISQSSEYIQDKADLQKQLMTCGRVRSSPKNKIFSCRPAFLPNQSAPVP